jgi:signal transduction histidine kinase/ActR/RegA family two-component response regulator
MRETCVQILASAGIGAEAVASAAEAEARHAALAPGVALVDQRLPDAPGVELGARLKERDADLTVLLVTGHANLENAIAAVWQVDGYLTKPVPPGELVRVVRAGLETSRLRRENRSLVDELRHANLMLEASVADRTSELSGLVKLAEAVAESSELDEVVNACLQTASEVTEAAHAALYLSDGADESHLLRLRASLGDRPFPAQLTQPPGASTFERDTRRLAEPTVRADDVVVLTVGGRSIGALVLGAANRRQPMFVATLAASAAVAIQNAQRFSREHETVERLSELSRMKSTLLAAVSHELRTPLAALLGLAELLTRRFEKYTPERRGQMLKDIIDQGQRLGVLIDDLLDATRVEFGGLRVTLGDVDITETAARVSHCFRAAGHPIVVRAAPNLPAAVGDERRLEQVLTNLVASALKHSPPDSPIEIDAANDGDKVRVSVTHSGTGIEPELLSSIFEPFTQPADTAPREDAIGLGLYIAHGLVEAMGGTIDVDSRLGEGSRFTIRLHRAGGSATPQT